MAHELDFTKDGKARMVFFDETPWHRFGQQLTEDELYDTEAAIKKGYMDFECEKVRLATMDEHKTPTDCYVIRRTDTGAILNSSNSVGPDFTILPNRDAFNWFKPFLETKEACLHTAGVLRNGSRIWILAKLNRKPMEVAKNDFVEKFILLSHAHDGTLAARAGFTPVRVVCANTLSMAQGLSSSELIRVRHTKNIKANLDAVRDVINAANASFEATAEQYRQLVKREINQKDVEKYVKIVFKIDENYKDAMSKPGRTTKRIEEILELFETGKGNNLPGVRGTMWAAYNAVTEYLSYSRGNTSESRVDSLWYGVNASTNRRAFDTALEVALAV